MEYEDPGEVTRLQDGIEDMITSCNICGEALSVDDIKSARVTHAGNCAREAAADRVEADKERARRAATNAGKAARKQQQWREKVWADEARQKALMRKEELELQPTHELSKSAKKRNRKGARKAEDRKTGFISFLFIFI